MSDEITFKDWAILELMGHRRLAGMVSEAQLGGASFIRIDIPGDNGIFTATQLYSPGAVYCITPTTEQIAKETAKKSQPAPVARWELQQIAASTVGRRYENEEDNN